jgi:hypothetical protein
MKQSALLHLAEEVHEQKMGEGTVMIKLGFTLSSEEFGPRDLVRVAASAEEAGFDYAFISDHFHPWIDEQGHSPFVWVVIGAVAQATQKLRLGTGVTCPTRPHSSRSGSASRGHCRRRHAGPFLAWSRDGRVPQ